MPWTKLLLLSLVCLTVGCKIQVDVPSGGDVTSESGDYNCTATQSSCTFDVSDLLFDEVFVAQPDTGFLFSGWKSKHKAFCGGSLEPCELSTASFADNDILMAILESEDVFYLEPTFIEEQSVRLYQLGDRIEFDGEASLATGSGPAVVSAVSASLEFFEGSVEQADKNVLSLQLAVVDKASKEQSLSKGNVWQESNGALFELSDNYGNLYQDAATLDEGVLAVPVPLMPGDEQAFDVFTLFGGHTSGPITSGTRTITVGEQEVIVTGLGESEVYPVTIVDSYTYAYTYAEHQRDSTVEKIRTYWISQVKGILKIDEQVKMYNPNGKLETTTTLEIEATRVNF